MAVLSRAQSGKQFREDFEYLWSTIQKHYCYWDKKQTNWNKVKALYSPHADTISSRKNFILFLEKVFYELYDHHASLSANTMESQRLVPSGTDIWAEYINDKPVITEVRKGSNADHAGIRAGMQLVEFNDVPIDQAIKDFHPKTLTKQDKEARNYALRVLLAGTHSGKRKISLKSDGMPITFYPDEQIVPVNEKHQIKPDIESKIFTGGVGYILINNRLWDNNLIPLFDSVMASLSHTRSLILDLRETPGGGNTTVARSIIGRFISKEGFYQKHELTSEEQEFGIKRSWMEIASPKLPVYSKPLVILVNHWTGSVGEGIAIGFDALKRATIIGTPMAGLNGAIYSFTMPHSGIGFSIPAEKLFHVNGTPREDFKPSILVNVYKSHSEDPILNRALQFLKNKN